MAREKHRNVGWFAGTPLEVIRSDAYKSLSGNAVKLLTILTYFYKGYNNGNLAITQSIIGEWMTKNTMYSAKDELHKKGFIVINAYGGRSAWGRKLPSLYGLTFQPIDELREKNWELRFAHYPASHSPLNYWKEGKNIKQRKKEMLSTKKILKKL